jgi:hypothetical protein
MQKRLVLLTAGLLAVFVTVLPLAAFACGQERWDVKTGMDLDAKLVDPSVIHNTRIAAMRSWPAPNHPPSKNRVAPYETQVWTVNATLKAYALEKDSDYHLVLADPSGNTIIAEIPAPNCVGPTSPFAEEIAHARKVFDEKLQANATFQNVSIPVRVTGVGFFDFHHGHNGVAPNAVELHPVLDIIFNPSGNQPHLMQ